MSDTNQENMTTQSIAAMEAPVSSQVANMSIHQLYQLLSQMKDLIQQNQQQARQILIANPPLTKTLFQAQVMLGMVRAPEKSPLVAVQTQTSQPGQTHTQQVQSIQPQGKSVPQAPVQQVPTQTGQPQMPTQAQHSQGSMTVTQQPIQSSFSFQQPVLSQAPSVPLQSGQSFPYQQNIQPHQQPTPLPNMVSPHSQPMPSSSLQAPMQHTPAHSSLPLQPPPVSQRSVGTSSQSQHQISQGMGFHPHQSPVAYHTQHPYQQQGSSQTNLSVPFQQVHPTLPNHAMQQHMFQAGRGPGGIWNQSISSTGPSAAPQTISTPQMISGHHSYAGSASGSSLNHVQGYGQPLAQSQSQSQSQAQQHLQQTQIPIEAEQQKALLQQVMNLTLEQINSLPPEQRQQVLQLQQAFRSQAG